jgi:hypothetical protein
MKSKTKAGLALEQELATITRAVEREQEFLKVMSHELANAGALAHQWLLSGRTELNRTNCLRGWAKASIIRLSACVDNEVIRWVCKADAEDRPTQNLDRTPEQFKKDEQKGELPNEFKTQLIGMANQYLELSLEVQNLI